MLVLTVDTSTPAVTAGIVRLGAAPPETLAVRVTTNARAHAEVLTPQILDCLAEAGAQPADLGAVVVGAGPGPFTGLRVGMVTGAAFGDALGIPVHGVCSLDAIAAEAALDEPEPGAEPRGFLVVTDARRREVYWARYSGGARVAGPAVDRPAEVPTDGIADAAGSAEHAALLGLHAVGPQSPSPRGLVLVAAAAIVRREDPAPLEPLYLRRPDAAEPSPRLPASPVTA